MKLLVPAAWTLWTASAAVLIYALYGITTGITRSGDSLRIFGQLVFVALLLVDLMVGGVLYWATTRQSVATLTFITTVLAIPFALYLFFSSTEPAYKRLTLADVSREGFFPDDQLQPLSDAIRDAKPLVLRKALGTRPYPKGKDNTGHDLLTYAVRRYRFYNGSLDCVKILLASGADPDTLDPKTGRPLITDLGAHPAALRVFVEAGANIESRSDGLSPVVYFTMTREWDSAIYLVEKGARLDTRDDHGISLDYYLAQWKDSVEDQHPKGWDRLRAAITSARRANPSVAARLTPPSPPAPQAVPQH